MNAVVYQSPPSYRDVLARHWRQLLCMTVLAFGVRALLFEGYMAPFFRQPDTREYHELAMGMAAGLPPCIAYDRTPVFWRTPGYPWYLASVYTWCQRHIAWFPTLEHAIHAALWIQIVFCSVIPFLSFLLAWVITRHAALSLAAGWIAALHLGFVLSSMHLQTDGMALVFLLAFFVLWFAAVRFDCTPRASHYGAVMAFAGAILGIYTWIRPMGLFIMHMTGGLSLVSRGSWREKGIKLLACVVVFFAVISGWYVRNYRLTGQLFYNPTWGVTLIAYCMPKLLMRQTGRPYPECLRVTQLLTHRAVQREMARVQAEQSPHAVVKEQVYTQVALPHVRNNPCGFLADWTVQICKTMGDLYTALLVACVKNRQWEDDLTETLSGKVSECLWTYPIPLWMRVLAWIELAALIVMWLGFFAGCVLFLLGPWLVRALPEREYVARFAPTWLQVSSVIGGLLLMTGANGYARLRLPADMLIIILSLMFWFWLVREVCCRVRSVHLIS